MTARTGCQGCREGAELDFTFTMAFQPILDLPANRVWGYEALVRGPGGESAASILGRVTPETVYRFDQAARVKAIELAGQLFPADDATRLSINFMPNAVYEPAACIRSSLEAARKAGFAHDRIMFEFTENEKFRDTAHVSRIVAEYRRQGFLTALDDFGAGFAGLSLLANFQPDLIKIDMDLLRGIDTDQRRQIIVAGIIGIARALDIAVIAEGVETASELATLRSLGATLFQGYHFAKPHLEELPQVSGFPVAGTPAGGYARAHVA
jgi:EAL domain-containing protein (putative c-di-GMP-specific phosphodiesterase class I)